MVINANKVYSGRPLSLYLEDWTYPPGIEKLVEALFNTRRGWKDGSKRLLLLVEKESVAAANVIADILAGLADHADMVISFPLSQVLRSLKRDTIHHNTDLTVLQLLERADIFGVYRVAGLDERDRNLLDHELAYRGDLQDKVTILIGPQVNEFNLTIESHGKDVQRC